MIKFIQIFILVFAYLLMSCSSLENPEIAEKLLNLLNDHLNSSI